MIIRRAQLGKFDFDDAEWDAISNEAKDLIQSCYRSTQRSVYRLKKHGHPWMVSKLSEEPLSCGSRHRGVSIDQGIRNFISSSQRWRSVGTDVLTELSVINRMKSLGTDTSELLKKLDSKGKSSDSETATKA